MLSRADVQRISSIFQWCSKLAIFPFDWTHEGILEIRPSKSLWWFQQGINTILLGQIAAGGAQFLEIKALDEDRPAGPSFEKLGIVVLLAVIRLGILVFQETVWGFRDELADLIYKTLHIQKLVDLWELRRLFERKETTEYLRLFLFGLSLTVLSSGGLSIVIDMTFGRPKDFGQFLLIILANVLVYSRHILNVYVVTLSIVPSILNLIFWLKKCISDAAIPDEVNLERSVRVYRCAILFSKMFNNVFGYYFIPYGKLLITIVVLLSTYSVISFRSTLNPLTYAALLVIFVSSSGLLLITSLATSSFYNYARQYKKNLSIGILGLEDQVVRKCLVREMSSCALIRCQVGSFYYMEEKAKLTMADSIIHGITFLLVSFK